jgi:hypothetical protein
MKEVYDILNNIMMGDTIDQLKSDLRDVKLKLLLESNIQFEPNIKRLRKGNNFLLSQPYWTVIQKWKGEAVLSGSAALYAFGLIDRLPKDIDFLITESPKNQILSSNRYVGMEAEMDLMGYYVHKQYNVDFFELKNQHFIEKDGYKFHHPLEIIECKMSIMDKRWNDSKDFFDIIEVFKKLDPTYKFEPALNGVSRPSYTTKSKR